MIQHYNSKLIREKIADRLNDADAILAMAKGEDRPPNDEEKAQVDTILAEIGEEGDDDKAPTGLYADLARAEKFDQIKGKLSRPSGEITPLPQSSAKISFPAYRGAPLRGFQNSKQGQEDAYKAGRWIAACVYGHEKSMQWCNDHGIAIRNAQTEGNVSKGGVLVPHELETAIIRLVEERGVFARYARMMTMGSETMEVPRRTGGLTAYFVNENTEITASDKTWDSVTLTARKLGVLVKYSSELSEDAFIDIASDLSAEIGYTVADKQDECGFNGDGTSTYGGITGALNVMAAGSIYTALTGNTAFSTLDLVDFEGVAGKLPQYAEMNAAWFIHKTGYYASMARLADAAGGNTVADIAGGANQRTFLGYPVVFSQVLNSTTTAQVDTNIALFGDLRMAAMMGMRRGVSIMVSTDRFFELDQLAIKGTVRFDINVHERGTATAPGALLVLRTPSS